MSSPNANATAEVDEEAKAAEAPSIVSLIPSGTDIACALGLDEYLQAVSHACDNPLALGLPIATCSVLPENLSPREIDGA